MDNFSYDEVHVAEWQMPPELAKHLPQELRDAAQDWVFSGAAVCTALERIEKMDKEAINRTDPAITHGHLLNRRVSDQTQAGVGAETPMTNSAFPSIPSTPAPVVPWNKNKLMQSLPQLTVNMAGLESPPYTPADSKVPNTPVSEPLVGPNGTVPDLDSVDAQLSPLSSRNSLTLSSPGINVKNEKAWEYYVGSFNEALRDIRKNVLARLRGSTRIIDRMRIEIPQEAGLSVEHKVALNSFEQWWATMKPKVSAYQQKVEDIEEKRVATQTQLEAMRNPVCGLPF